MLMVAGVAMVGRKAMVVSYFALAAMPLSPYKGGKRKRHFTLSDQAYNHLSAIAGDARLSRSEALERLIRSVPVWEGSSSLANGAWKLCVDYASDSPPALIDDENFALD
jgi:hypothetical protein